MPSWSKCIREGRLRGGTAARALYRAPPGWGAREADLVEEGTGEAETSRD